MATVLASVNLLSGATKITKSITLTIDVVVNNSKFINFISSIDRAIEKQNQLIDATKKLGREKKFHTNIKDAVSMQRELNKAIEKGNKLAEDAEKFTKKQNKLNSMAKAETNEKKQSEIAGNEEEKGSKKGGGFLVKQLKSSAERILTPENAIRAMGSLVTAANQKINTEIEFQVVMGNIDGITQDGIEAIRQQTQALSVETTINSGIGLGGVTELAKFVQDSSNIGALTESMYNLAVGASGATDESMYNLPTAASGADVTQEKMDKTANLLGKAMAGDASALSGAGITFSDKEQDLFKMGTEAERTAMLIEKIESKYGGLAKAVADTPEGQIIQMQNAWGGVKEEIGLGILPIILRLVDTIKKNMPQIQTLIGSLVIPFNIIGFAITGVIEIISWLVNVISDNWGFFQSVLLTIIGTLAYGLIPQIGALIPLILSTAASWIVANLPIIAIIAAILVLIKIFNFFGITVDQIIGFVVGVFAGLLAHIFNVVQFVWNLFASLSEFLINFFRDPAYAIKKIFYDLAINILEILKSMAGGLEKFINLLPSVNVTFVDSLQSVIDGFEKPETNKDVISLVRSDYIDVREAGQAGYDLGQSTSAGIADKLKQGIDLNTLTDKFKAPELSLHETNLYSLSEDSSIDTVGQVGEIGQVRDTVDISSEDIKSMRELAELRNIQNFVSMTPSVTVQTGDINNGYDIDTIVTRISNYMEGELNSSAQGAYGYGQ